MNRIKLWPHGVLVILGVALVAGIAAALWFRYERTAKASGLPNAARIERVDGQVGVNRSLDSETNSQWIEAKVNTPVSVGDRIYTKDNSRTEIAFTGRNGATVDPNTSLDILDLSKDRTQVALRSGSAVFDVGSISSGQIFEVATPCGAVDLKEPGTYQLVIDPSGNASATAFSGSAQVVGQAGSSTIHKGEVLSVPCQDGSAATISGVNYDQAGTYLDNHFRYRYPRTYDGRYRSYYTYLDDPYYYDPYQRYNSYNYVSDYIPGTYDLDDYGDWSYVNDYGYCWHPRVDTGWAPYQSGYWEMDYPYGLTWVSNEPWGYAPYHYGRWAYTSNEWFWVPESTSIYPSYSPALTAFIPLGGSSMAWVALGPGDPYVPRYYDPYWQPVYLTSPTVSQSYVNIGVPGAVTAVPVQSFTQVIDRRDIIQVDPQTIAQARPVIDPLTVDPLRQVAFQTRRGQARLEVPQSVTQRIMNTPVMVANSPVAPPFKRDLASALRVQPLSARAQSQQRQLRDERTATAQPQSQPQAQSQSPNIAAEQARERQMADLARQAARGDRGARQQMQELRRQQMNQARVEGQANQTTQGERVGQPVAPAQNQRQLMRQQPQAQREAARQQTINDQQLRKAEAPRIQSQREARPPQIQRTQPPVIRGAPNPQPVRSQTPPRRMPEVQVQRPQSQPRVMSAPRPQAMPQQPRPQMERRGPPARMPQPQAQPRAQAQPQAQPRPQAQAQPRMQPQPQPRPQAQPQPRVQQQAQPHPQSQAQPKGPPKAQPEQQQQQPGKPQGKPPKKP